MTGKKKKLVLDKMKRKKQIEKYQISNIKRWGKCDHTSIFTTREVQDLKSAIDDQTRNYRDLQVKIKILL